MSVGAERAVLESPEKVGEHMKPLYIKEHLMVLLSNARWSTRERT
jgi:hypothetical protein